MAFKTGLREAGDLDEARGLAPADPLTASGRQVAGRDVADDTALAAIAVEDERGGAEVA